MAKRKKKKRDKAEIATGVAWYRRDQWQRLLDVSADREKLEETYEEWLTQAELKMGKLAQSGIHATKMDIDVEELLRWAEDQGRLIDGNARVEFTIRKLKEMHEKEG